MNTAYLKSASELKKLVEVMELVIVKSTLLLSLLSAVM